MDNDSIYYYTSDFVLKNWLKSENIWATRSITSNDETDSNYLVDKYDIIEKHFNELNEKDKVFTAEEISDMLSQAKKLCEYSKFISLRTVKDFLNYYILYYPEEIESTISIVRRANETLASSHIKRDKLDLLEILCAKTKSMTNMDGVLPSIFDTDDHFDKDALLDAIIKKHPYCICFTSKGDDRFFWDSYTENKGVAIEFSKHEIEKYFGNNILSHDIIYGVTEDFKKDNNIFDIIFEMIKGLKETQSSYLGMYGEIIYALGCIVKHPYWENEKEFRVAFFERYMYITKFAVKENYNLKYKNRYKTQDYIEIAIPKRLVKSITTGPLNSKYELEKYLRNELEKEIEDKEQVNSIMAFAKDKIRESNGKGVIKK